MNPMNKFTIARFSLSANSARVTQRAFTLIELITVIAVIALLAALAMPVMNMVANNSHIQAAISERKAVETAIEAYHADYGFYPPSNPNVNPPYLTPALTNQLYYELEGTTASNTPSGYIGFTNLDNSGGLSSLAVQNVFAVSGFMNCTRGTGEDAKNAQNYLPRLKPGQIATFTNTTTAGVEFVHLLTSGVVADAGYQPLGPGILTENGHNANPWRYIYPGINNPKSYDLWLQLEVGGKSNLICNWNNQQQINATNYP
jgi:prepilin-type N-terminal cleavage/methylation domain-containing protein